jgi:hypothetical protein
MTSKKQTNKTKPKTSKKEWPPRMSEEELRTFVDDYVSGRIFASSMIQGNDEEVERMLQLVFVPLALGGLNDVSQDKLENIGIIWEKLSAAQTRSVNNYPMFFSCRCMHKDDCNKVGPALLAEAKRRENIKV